MPINRRNYVSPISKHFSKVPINRGNYVSPISRHFSKDFFNLGMKNNPQILERNTVEKKDTNLRERKETNQISNKLWWDEAGHVLMQVLLLLIIMASVVVSKEELAEECMKTEEILGRLLKTWKTLCSNLCLSEKNTVCSRVWKYDSAINNLTND